MALVTLAALFMALLFVLFKVFGDKKVALLPAIVVNYLVAFACGLLVAPAWRLEDILALAWPAALLGFLFITVFHLTGLSSQRAGVAATAVASKMSLVLTVAAAVVLNNEDPGVLGWTGIALALCGVVLTTWIPDRAAVRGAWVLPSLLFFGNAVIDTVINQVQRLLLTPYTEAVFPTLVFGVAGVLGLAWTLAGRGRRAFAVPSTWIGGALLGVTNYAALYFVVRALSRSGLGGSAVYPLVNIGVILFGTLLSVLLFRDRPRRRQVVGIAIAVAALVLILLA